MLFFICIDQNSPAPFRGTENPPTRIRMTFTAKLAFTYKEFSLVKTCWAIKVILILVNATLGFLSP